MYLSEPALFLIIKCLSGSSSCHKFHPFYFLIILHCVHVLYFLHLFICWWNSLICVVTVVSRHFVQMTKKHMKNSQRHCHHGTQIRPTRRCYLTRPGWLLQTIRWRDGTSGWLRQRGSLLHTAPVGTEWYSSCEDCAEAPKKTKFQEWEDGSVKCLLLKHEGLRLDSQHK